MFIKTIVSVLAAAAVTSAASCSEVDRFGTFTITPNTGLQPGSTVSVSANFECSFEKGIAPKYTTYQASVGPKRAAVFLATRDPAVSADQPFDNFTTTIPDAFWDADTAYGITLWTYYDVKGPNSGSYLSEGGVGGGSIAIGSTTPA